MENSLRLVPSKQPAKASISDTANSFGLHDTLIYGPRNLTDEIKSTNPLQARLENWDETQRNLKLTMHRNIYGLHAPVRQLMERKIVSYVGFLSFFRGQTNFTAQNPHMPAMPRSNIHLDILEGRDETLDVADFFSSEPYPTTDIHSEMERKLRM
ncbi:proteasome maturation factor UMP1 [Lactarius hengduanensis]|nr:proteasome maturation factor UMP1 [Lactarius hengduanensis]